MPVSSLTAVVHAFHVVASHSPDGSNADEYFNPEFDEYLQEVLWGDDDYVRAIDEIHQEASKKVSTRLVSVLLSPFLSNRVTTHTRALSFFFNPHFSNL